MRQFEYQIDRAWVNKRLDIFLSEAHSELSRSFLQRLIDSRQVSVNGKPVKPNYKIKKGDHVAMTVPDPDPLEVVAEPIPLEVIFEDSCFLVIDKPAGIVVHPAPGHSQGTLVNALLHHCSDLTGIGGVERPGIVHRLDKDTSGLVVVAKTDQALHSLAKQFKERVVRKQYLSLVQGMVKTDRGIIDRPIGRHKLHRKKMAPNKDGREAITEYQVVERFDGFSYLNLFPKTGRTHQIRVHLASLGHPILGDKLYGGNKIISHLPELKRQVLHARRLELIHPVSGQKLNFESPLPKDFLTILKIARRLQI